MIPNPLVKKLAASQTVLGVAVRQARTVDIARIMKTAGYDFLFIDTEHTPVPADVVSQICQAALGSGIAPIVRTPNLERVHAIHALDSGAQGLVFPTWRTPTRRGTSSTSAAMRRPATAPWPTACPMWSSPATILAS